MFYNALIKFRNEQLENYQGQPLEYSASDYHHISRLPASSANRRKHARVQGGSRRQGQNSTTTTTTATTTSNSSSKQPQSKSRALKSSATEKSYDPFRSPRHIVATPEVQCAQVTIHRNGPEANTKEMSEAVPDLDDDMKEEEVEDIDCLPSSPFSIVPNKKSKASFTRSFQSRASHSSARRVMIQHLHLALPAISGTFYFFITRIVHKHQCLQDRGRHEQMLPALAGKKATAA